MFSPILRFPKWGGLSSHWSWSLGLLTLLMLVTTASAQTANFGTVSLRSGFPRASGSLDGYTQGSFSLPSIANRDQDGNFCLGYADANPDHIIELQQDFAQLTIQVNSRGNDTTLLIQGPNGSTIRCADNAGQSKDAIIQDIAWAAGTYRVWVGSFERGGQYDYTLTVRED